MALNPLGLCQYLISCLIIIGSCEEWKILHLDSCAAELAINFRALTQFEIKLHDFRTLQDLRQYWIFLLQCLGDTNLAYQAFRLALAANNDHAEAYNNLGVLEMRKGHIEQVRSHQQGFISQAQHSSNRFDLVFFLAPPKLSSVWRVIWIKTIDQKRFTLVYWCHMASQIWVKIGCGNGSLPFVKKPLTDTV